jgi:hypothetical protein
MYGSCEIVKNNNVLNSPELKHFSDLSEISDIGEKCKSLSERAMKSSIHCASSIGEIKSLLKTDLKNIIDVIESMNNDLLNLSQDLTVMSDHITKLSAVLYEVQDVVKDKMKSFDEKFQNFDRVLSDYGDIIKETHRKVASNHTPQIIPQPRLKPPAKPTLKLTTKK